MPGPRVNTTPAWEIARRHRSLGRDKPGRPAPLPDRTMKHSPSQEPSTMLMCLHLGQAGHGTATDPA